LTTSSTLSGSKKVNRPVRSEPGAASAAAAPWPKGACGLRQSARTSNRPASRHSVEPSARQGPPAPAVVTLAGELQSETPAAFTARTRKV